MHHTSIRPRLASMNPRRPGVELSTINFVIAGVEAADERAATRGSASHHLLATIRRDAYTFRLSEQSVRYEITESITRDNERAWLRPLKQVVAIT